MSGPVQGDETVSTPKFLRDRIEVPAIVQGGMKCHDDGATATVGVGHRTNPGLHSRHLRHSVH